MQSLKIQDCAINFQTNITEASVVRIWLKMTRETQDVRFAKRKPREERKEREGYRL